MRYEQEAGLWNVVLDDDRKIPWKNLQTGPLAWTDDEIETICHELLGYGTAEVRAQAERVLVPAVGPKAALPALILHSTTPDLRTREGDLDALIRGGKGGDFTTYKEARSVYLGGPHDVPVGRTQGWKDAVEALGAEAIELEDSDHYYISHALLALARQHHADGNVVSMQRLLGRLRETPHRARLYAFELELQIFLLWAAQEAALEELPVEANTPSISADWNRKSVLHPTITEALDLQDLPKDPWERLASEHSHCELARRMELETPAMPGYTLERPDRSVDDFVRQLLDAAALLQERYQLDLGCLKASESGDGARIFPGLDLTDHEALRQLAREAHVYGDDYVLEAHVHYGQASIAGQSLPTSPSTHLRGGEVAYGATLQFMEGTSWKGNVLLDEHCLDQVSISAEHYARLRAFTKDFRDAFEEKDPGLVIAGIDFAIGSVGGAFGDAPLLGVQDLNVSFTGAECLRAFLDKAKIEQTPHKYGVTRIYRPHADANHAGFLRVTKAFHEAPVCADTVASIAGRWAMVGITGEAPSDAVQRLQKLQKALEEAGLI